MESNYLQELEKAYRSTTNIGYMTSTCVIVYGLVTYGILKSQKFLHDPVQAPYLKWLFLMLSVGTLASIPILKNTFLEKASFQTVEEFIKKLQSYSIVIFALCESIAVYGLALALMTKNMNDYYWLGGLSLIAFIYMFPKYEKWEEWLKSRTFGAGSGH